MHGSGVAGSAKDSQLRLASDQAFFKLLLLTKFSQLRDERCSAFGVSRWCCADTLLSNGAKHPSCCFVACLHGWLRELRRGAQFGCFGHCLEVSAGRCSGTQEDVSI